MHCDRVRCALELRRGEGEDPIGVNGQIIPAVVLEEKPAASQTRDYTADRQIRFDLHAGCADIVGLSEVVGGPDHRRVGDKHTGHSLAGTDDAGEGDHTTFAQVQLIDRPGEGAACAWQRAAAGLGDEYAATHRAAGDRSDRDASGKRVADHNPERLS